MPTKSEENKQVIQHRYDALGRGDTDSLFARMHKGDPQERDCRVLRNMIFIASMGLAMILAAIFTTVLELPDFWRNLWLAICISFAFLFFVGVLRLGSELSGKLAQCKLRDMEPVGSSPETQVLGHGHEIAQVTQLHSDYAHGATENGKSPMNPSTNGTTRQGPSQVRALIKEPTTKEKFQKRREEVSNAWRNDRGRATLRRRLGKRFKRILFGIGLVLILAVGGLYFFARTASYESTDDAFVDGHITNVAPESGRVTHKSVEPGDYVQVGQNLLASIPSNIWVTANFKENQLALMRPGQPVEIEVDALGGRTFKGHVDSVQMGSGAAFSLLPPENATGNYVKVVQRVPVKILFDPIPNVGLPLGPGDSVVPTVKVQDFRYSGSQLLVVAALTGAAILGVLWWGNQDAQSKEGGLILDGQSNSSSNGAAVETGR
jgi:hypothetical protein